MPEPTAHPPLRQAVKATAIGAWGFAVQVTVLGCGNAASSGASATPSCEPPACTDSIVVPGGEFLRGNDPRFPARVSDFSLERDEVTVGKFRRFLQEFDAWRGAGNPVAGAGAHPRIAESGWQADWPLARSTDELAQRVQCDPIVQTFSPQPGVHEDHPINCVNWYEAFAYCAWAGGRLPTEAEWNYAAAGGDEQRIYPWGDEEPGPNVSHAIYGCYLGTNARCDLDDIAKVGSAPAGNGRWGHRDLAGNVWEWVLDVSLDYPASCDDCAVLSGGANRGVRGGSFYNIEVFLRSSHRVDASPIVRNEDFGFRCARSVALALRP
jgi:sulfatase modifying factor 1